MDRIPQCVADILLDNRRLVFPVGICSGGEANYNAFLQYAGSQSVTLRIYNNAASFWPPLLLLDFLTRVFVLTLTTLNQNEKITWHEACLS